MAAYMPMVSQESDEGSFKWNGHRCRGGPLHLAALQGQLDMVKAAIEGKPNKLAIVQSRCTFMTDDGEEGSAEAIHMGASRSHEAVVQYLLEARADLSAAVIIGGRRQYDVLHAAVSGEGCGGRVEIVENLLQAKAPVTTDADGKSLLHVAFQTGNVPVIKLLRKEVDHAPAAPVHSLSQRSFSMKVDPSKMTDAIPPPLSLGIRGGKLKEETLSQYAELTPTSLKIFIDECPQCIPSFLDRIAEMEEEVDEADHRITAVDIARNLTKDDIAKVLRESPEAALALLKQSTEVPVCENSGWHPLPTRVSFAERHNLERIMTWFNPPRPFRTYYMKDHVWKFNSIKFESPEWHKDLTNRSFGRPILDAEIRVCHVPNILCAEVFSALCDGNNVESDGIANDDVVRAAVRHVFWNGCVRVDLTTVLLNFWGLGLLILEEFLLFEGQDPSATTVTRSGKGIGGPLPARRLHSVHTAGGNSQIFGLDMFSVELDDHEKLPPWIAITWIGAKGLIDLWQEWCQFRGFCEIGRYKDYFALDNLLDMIFSCLPMFLFFNPGNLIVLVAAVFLYWVRLLDCFTSAEYIGLELLPIKKLFSGLVPASTVTLVAFCAFTHAFYIVDGGAKYPMVDIVFESFATLITAAMPPDLAPTELVQPGANLAKLVLCLMAVSFFSVFILNIFIGVMGEIYVKEKERAESTFRMDRAKSCFQYLLRCRILPCSILSWNGGMILMVCAGVVALATQIYAFCNHDSYISLSVPFFICQALIMLGAYQSPESPWAKGYQPEDGQTSSNYMWYCKHREPEKADPVVEDVHMTVEELKSKLAKMKEFNARGQAR